MPYRRLVRLILTFAGALSANPALSAEHTYPWHDELKNVPQAMAQYESTKKAALELMERFPPERYLYVGIGKSPTPIIAFIKAIGGNDAAQSLPLTGLGSNGIFKKEDPQSVAKLREHLSAFLPDAEQLGERKILILDFADTATSLDFSAQEIRSFLNISNPQRKIEIEVVGIPGSRWATKQLRAKGFQVLKVNRDLRRSLLNHEYKRLHEFEDYDRNVNSPYEKPARRSTEYLKEKARAEAEMNRGRMAQPDAELAAKFRDISARRGFDNLVSGYGERAAGDEKLVKILEKKYPFFLKHLETAQTISRTATAPACVRWFHALVSTGR